MPNTPLVSIILATHNRREVLLGTLGRVYAAARTAGDFEIIVVDNRSRDGTVKAVRERFTDGVVTVIEAQGNLGSCAKSLGVQRATGEFSLFLDDDSWPRLGCIERMIEHLRGDRYLGAVGFQVHLPDGTRESSALPNVFVGCGVGFRTQMLRDIGSLDPSLFMQAEEYDLAFRMVAAGWRVECFEDCHVEHLKTPAARCSARTVYYDTRNNLIVLARYLPEPYFSIYRHDWNRRYRWIASANRHRFAHWRGLAAGFACGAADRGLYRPLRLDPAGVETLFRIEEIRQRVAEVRQRGAQRVVLADLGKNIYPFFRACRQCDLEVVAIADDRFAAPERTYRDVPIRAVDEALRMDHDAVIVANTSTVHAVATASRLRNVTERPVLDWFGQPEEAQAVPV